MVKELFWWKRLREMEHFNRSRQWFSVFAGLGDTKNIVQNWIISLDFRSGVELAPFLRIQF